MGVCVRERGMEREKRKKMGGREKKERGWEIFKDIEVI